MKKYYVYYPKNFSNCYSLYWADSTNADKVTENMERISREEALSLCAQESYRRKYDQVCSGFADNKIFPVDYEEATLTEMGHFVILEPNAAENRIMEWPSESVQKEARKIVQDFERIYLDKSFPWC